MPSTVPPIWFSLRRVALLVLLMALLPTATSTVAGQNLEVTFEENSVVVDDETVNTTLSVTGHNGTMTVRSENVSNGTLVRMFDGQETDDGVRVDVPDDGNLTARFPPAFRCSPGRYTFTVADGDRTANASIDVAVPLVPAAALESSSWTVSSDETVRVAVRVDRCHDGNVTLRVGGPDSSVHADVTVGSNASGYDNATIRFDTGDVTSPESFVVETDLDHRHVTVERTPPDGRLPAGGYGLLLYAEGEQVDVATLQIEDENPTPTPTRGSGDGETTTEPQGGSDAPANDSTGADKAGERPALDVLGFSFLVGIVAVLAAVVLLALHH